MAEASERLEEDVLEGLDADFQRSKAELIQRFLLDQEELNKRFEEYTLTSSSVETLPKDLPGCHPAEKDLDQLSTCSTIHGSDATLSDREDFNENHAAQKVMSDDQTKDHSRPRRGKKQLKKKLVRPKTAMESRPFLERVRHNMTNQNEQLKSAPNRSSLQAHPLHPQRSSTSWNPHQFQSGLSHIEERFSVLTELNMSGRPLTSSTVRPTSQANYNQRKSQKIQVLKLPPLDPTLTNTPSRVNRRTKSTSLHSSEFLVGEGF